MNSFNTHEDTEKVIHKYTQSKARILCFNQSRFPRIFKDNLLPVPDTPSDANKEAWFVDFTYGNTKVSSWAWRCVQIPL